MKRSLSAVCIFLLTSVGCSSTGPNTQLTGLWGYMASDLSDNEVLCSISVPMTLSQTDTILTGTFNGSFMACSSPLGASSTLADGTVSGTITIDSVAIAFQNTTTFNNGSVAALVLSQSGGGSHLSDQATYEGTATMEMTFGGVAHTLNGTFVARQQ